MKLFYTKGACSLACRIVINEIGVPCEYIAVDLKAKKTEQGEDFKKINPKGAVPTLMMDDNAILTENAVIQQFLADTHKAYNLLPAVGEKKRYQVLEWLNYVSTELHKGFSVFFNPVIEQEIKDKYFVPPLKSKFDYIDGRLQNKKYLLGEDFTLPDAYLFVILRWAISFKFSLKDWPNINDYFERLKKRESIAKSLAEEHLE